MARDRIWRADAKTIPATQVGSYGSLHFLRVLANAAIKDDIVERTVAHRGSISRESRLGAVTKVKRIDHLPLAQRRREVISEHGVIDQNAVPGYQMAVKVGNRRFNVGPKNKSVDPPRVPHPTKSNRQTANYRRGRNRIRHGRDPPQDDDESLHRERDQEKKRIIHVLPIVIIGA